MSAQCTRALCFSATVLIMSLLSLTAAWQIQECLHPVFCYLVAKSCDGQYVVISVTQLLEVVKKSMKAEGKLTPKMFFLMQFRVPVLS